MILSNFIKVMAERLNGSNAKSTGGVVKAYSFVPSSNITALSFSVYDNDEVVPTLYSITLLGIALSSDTAVPTVDDYQFVNFYTSSDLTNIDAVFNGDEPMQTVFTQTVRNDGTSNVVINSVGVFGLTSRESAKILLTKTLLDTPVTVAPGEVKTITVTIDYNSFVENVNA